MRLGALVRDVVLYGVYGDVMLYGTRAMHHACERHLVKRASCPALWVYAGRW